jgi:TonB-linked SusC/RagA family outer membrane protein
MNNKYLEWCRKLMTVLLITCSFVLLSTMNVLAFQDNSNQVELLVKGKVTGSDNKPVEGASITVKGSKGKGVSSNNNGEFTISVRKGDILQVTSIGFDPKEISIVNGDDLGITLNPMDKAMSEVIVTALGIKKEKRKVAYAAQEVKGAELEKAREANVLSNLTGKVAGLSIQTKSTLFENPDVSLRGGSTIVVIDGVPTTSDFWNVSPDDIDNITVLKGTSATALYGSLGINGAIMITTKKGKTGANGVEVSFNSTTQFQAGYLKIPETQTDYGMGWAGQYSFFDGRGGGLYDDYGYVYGPKLNQKDASTASGFVEIPQFNSPIDPVTGQRVPLPWITRSESNLKKFLRNELITTNNISVAGKSDQGEYRVSLTHLFQQGQVPNTHLNSTTLNLSGGLKFSEKFRMDATLSYNKQYTPNYPVTGYGPDNFFYNVILWLGPEADINDLRNYWVPGKEGTEQMTYNYTWYNNPWFLAHERLRGYYRDVLVGQVSGVYDFSKEFSLLVRSGINLTNTTSDIKTPWSFINYGSSKAPFGNYDITKADQFRIVTDAILTYKKRFLTDFNATVSVGASSRYENYSVLGSSTNGLSVPGVYNLSNSINPVTSTNQVVERQVNSVLGYGELSYKNEVYLNLTGRNDWSSTLQKPNNSFFYPSVSLGVIASEMVKLPTAISYLKFRGSWANISTDINPYRTLPVYTTGIRWNGQPSLVLPDSLISPGLKPNKTISQEYGTEIRFLKNRIGIDFTYYTYIDEDFVVPVPISQASGYKGILVNGDKVNRKGIEIVLNGTPIQKTDFSWNVTFNYSRNRSYQRGYYGGDTMRGLVKIGDRTDVLAGWKWDRSPDGKIVYDGGIPQYVNAYTKLGYTNPDWEFGFINAFTYKSFNFSFQFDGRIGGSMINGFEAKMWEGGMHKASANSYRDDAYNGVASYVGDGVVVTGGAVQYDAFGNLISDTRKFAPNNVKVNYIDWIFASYTNGIGDAVLYKRTFVKLREIVVGYNFAPHALRKTPFKSATISLVGRNLFLFTNVPFMDPDGYTDYSLAEPSYRNIGLNINLKF